MTPYWKKAIFASLLAQAAASARPDKVLRRFYWETETIREGQDTKSSIRVLSKHRILKDK